MHSGALSIGRHGCSLIDEIQQLGILVRDREIDPIVTAARVHEEIGRIHPFLDANGRFARA